MNKNKIVVIQDCIMLPAIGWGYDYSGPVMHPTSLSDDIIEKLLLSNPPVKFMYALNPEDYNKRVHLTLDNYKLTNEELFKQWTEYINPNNVFTADSELVSDIAPPVEITQPVTEVEINLPREELKPEIVEPKADEAVIDENIEEGSDEAIVSEDSQFTEEEIKEEVNTNNNKIKFNGGKKKR